MERARLPMWARQLLQAALGSLQHLRALREQLRAFLRVVDMAILEQAGTPLSGQAGSKYTRVDVESGDADDCGFDDLQPRDMNGDLADVGSASSPPSTEPCHSPAPSNRSRPPVEAPPALGERQMQYFRDLFSGFEAKTEQRQQAMLDMSTNPHTSMGKISQDLQSTQAQVAELQESRSIVDAELVKINGRCDQADTDIKLLQRTVAVPQSGPPHIAEERPHTTPRSQRTQAMLGNLGWDDTPDTIVERAETVLESARVPGESYNNLKASFRGSGSAAELEFGTPQLLREAAKKVEDLEKSFSTVEGKPKPVWLAPRKSKEELKPSRMARKMADFIQEVESYREDGYSTENVQVCQRSKSVSIQGFGRIGTVNQGTVTWAWSVKARCRYDATVLDEGAAFASNATPYLNSAVFTCYRIWPGPGFRAQLIIARRSAARRDSQRLNSFRLWLETVDLAGAIPTEARSLPEHVRAQGYTVASRLPGGDQELFQFPSLIDACAHSPRLLLKVSLQWATAVADHAALALDTALPVLTRARRQQQVWRCSNEQGFMSFFAARCPDQLRDHGELVGKIRVARGAFRDAASRKQRRADREPFLVKALRRRVREAPDAASRGARQRELWHALQQRFTQRKQAAQRLRICSGGVVASSTALSRVEALLLGPEGSPRVEIDPAVCREEALRHFHQKWTAAGDLASEAAAAAQAFVDAEWPLVAPSMEQWADAVSNMKSKAVCDGYGVAARAFQLAFQARAQIQGVLKSKTTSAPALNDLRALLPQPVLLQPMHLLLIDMAGPLVDSVADGLGAAADLSTKHTVIAGDIKAYYDNVEPLRVAACLTSWGADVAVGVALARLHLCPDVSLAIMGEAGSVGQRTRGLLTGSKSAGLCSRVPVVHVLGDTSAASERLSATLGPPAAPVQVLPAFWADNCYAVGADPQQAIELMRTVGSSLQKHWKLELKPSSRQILVHPSLLDSPNEKQLGEWEVRTVCLDALGFMIHVDGSHQAMLDGAVAKAWKSFWRQRVRSAGRLPVRLAMRNMTRAVWAGFRYRLPPIAPAPTLRKRLDAAQRKMVGMLHGPVRAPPGEQPTPAEAAKAYHKGISELISDHGGPWGERWQVLSGTWRAHLLRHWRTPAARALAAADGLATAREITRTENFLRGKGTGRLGT
ncbi:unnamed protein product, partial [Prorocentrum cordatum]